MYSNMYTDDADRIVLPDEAIFIDGKKGKQMSIAEIYEALKAGKRVFSLEFNSIVTFNHERQELEFTPID